MFIAARISYIHFFTAVHIYDFHISTVECNRVTIHKPNVSTLLTSTFIRGDLFTATRGPFICLLISCLFVWRGVNRRQVVDRHNHDLKERGRS